MSFDNNYSSDIINTNLHKLCDVHTSFLIHLRSFELVMRNDKELGPYMNMIYFVFNQNNI